MGFEQTIVRVGVEVYGNRVFERGGKFLPEVIDEFGYPAPGVVILAVTDKQVVFVSGDDAGHEGRRGLHSGPFGRSKIERLAAYWLPEWAPPSVNREHFLIFDHSFFKLMFKRIPPILRNFYSLTGILFLVWMIFLDSNDLINRFRLTAKLRSLEHEKEYYREKIKEVEQDRSELMGTNELLEKFAREKYLMKRDTEDIYIIEEAD